MDREQIIRMAREAGFDPHDMSADFTCNLIDIERFAALVAAAEREACAALCDEREEIFQKYYSKGLPALCASAIRARLPYIWTICPDEPASKAGKTIVNNHLKKKHE